METPLDDQFWCMCTFERSAAVLGGTNLGSHIGLDSPTVGDQRLARVRVAMEGVLIEEKPGSDHSP